MELIIGGYSQGKLDYCIGKYKEESFQILNGERLAEICPVLPTVPENNRLLIHGIHLFFQTTMKNNKSPEAYLERLVEAFPNCILISDEIGNGIVPMDRFQREYRERTGRYLVALAKKAESVERVICGMSQTIK